MHDRNPDKPMEVPRRVAEREEEDTLFEEDFFAGFEIIVDLEEETRH
jgi:hypothetical protein